MAKRPEPAKDAETEAMRRHNVPTVKPGADPDRVSGTPGAPSSIDDGAAEANEEAAKDSDKSEADRLSARLARAGRGTNKAMMTPNSKDFDDAENDKKYEYETLEDGMIIRDPSDGDQRYFGEEVEVDGEKQFVPGVKKGFKLQLSRKEAEFLQSRDIRIGRVKKEGVKEFAPEDASFKGAPEPEEV